MIFPCFEAILAMLKKDRHAPYFVPGETELAAMTEQLKKLERKKKREKYTRLMEPYACQNSKI